MKPSLPVLSCVIVPDVFFAFLIATRPSFILRLLGSFILVFLSYYVAATYSTGDVGGDWSFGSALGSQPLNVVLLLWSSDPMKEFRYTSDLESKALAERPLGSRFYKAWCILRNPRFIGLNIQLSNVRPFHGTRFQFIRSRILRILRCLLLMDLGQSFAQIRPEYFLQGTSAFPSGLYGHVLHFACQVSFALCAYAGMNLLYTTTSLICVIIGSPWLAGTPELWPDMFGSLLDAYTVRRTWGRVWHQTLRRNFYILGKSVAVSQGARPRSFLSSQIQVWVAFTLSGILHCFGDLMIGTQFVGRSMPFFLMNAAAITFEDSVIAVTRKIGLSHARIIGYVWVLMWFNYSLPTFYTWTLELGLGKKMLFPSLAKFVVPQHI